MIWSLSWKNVWRNRGRSLILIMAISSGLVGGILSMGIVFGMMNQIVNSAIETRLGHIQIHHPDFAENKDIRHYIPEGIEILKKIKKDEKLSINFDRHHDINCPVFYFISCFC